ncbi:hypothetical protein SAMN04489725_1183 [Alicyclobacillus hesperidum]|uniref:Uncharacterized protein n=1 Tax=Alicyclobacillus hesperidum TaxID=89784 RepID=A0A1H2X3Q6_9BACL|nr:hypothetical protein SAMN04489725_1183 [Alicyclobacillus hesperidum]
MSNVLWTFLVHTAAMYLAFAVFVVLCFIVVNALVKE